MHLFALSSPDLSINPFINGIAENFALVIRSGQANAGPNHLESLESKVSNLHQEILSDAQRTWFQPLPDHFNVADNQPYKAQLNTIYSEFKPHTTVLIHDPLLCRFLPLWNADETPSVYLLNYSEPLECAINLQQQWRFPLNVGLALWESYVLDAVKYLTANNSVLLSSKKLRGHEKPNLSKRHLKSVCAKLEKLSDKKFELTGTLSLEPAQLTTALPENYNDLLEHVNKAQHEIFAALESGKLGALKKRSLSKQSADTLEYYGQIRAGFEILKAQYENQKVALATMQQQAVAVADQANSNVSASSIDTSTDTSTNEINTPNAQPINTVTEQHPNLISVKLILRGMSPVEFLSEADSPILNMLQTHLLASNQDQDEMIYLNSVGAENEAMYFMASSLLTIETQSMTQH